MNDDEIAREIQSRGLEIEYLRELAASLGFADAEGWTEALFEAIDHSSPEQRRRAALRTLALQEGEGEEG
jgi:hypothetical protein